jgi:CheY-like chemotaxis protein
MSVIEIMPVDEKVAHLIAAGALPDVLAAAARPAGMRTLWESGLRRVWQGVTSIDEVIRVLGERPQEDRGTTFATSSASGSPPNGPPTAAPLAPLSPPEGGDKTKVLVADDDRQMRRLIRMILERDGYQVAEAADGLDALEAIESGQFDLMILDLDMPRLDGIGVLEELRARVVTSSLPVIVLTARTGEAETQVLDLGAQDFLTKPVQPPSLQARVRAVLRRSRMQ